MICPPARRGVRRVACDTDRPPRGAGPCQAACMNHLIKYAESKDRSTYFMEIVIPIPLKSNGRRESDCFEYDFIIYLFIIIAGSEFHAIRKKLPYLSNLNTRLCVRARR